jgi:hypothetical protein
MKKQFIPSENNSTLSVATNLSQANKVLVVVNVDSVDSTKHGQYITDPRAGWCCSTYKINKVLDRQ